MAKDRKNPFTVSTPPPAPPQEGRGDVAVHVSWHGKQGETVYVGPAYVRGIGIPEREGLLRPMDWTQEQISEFITLYPRYSEWFETAPMTDPGETL